MPPTASGVPGASPVPGAHGASHLTALVLVTLLVTLTGAMTGCWGGEKRDGTGAGGGEGVGEGVGEGEGAGAAADAAGADAAGADAARADAAQEPITCFVGSASKPATEEVAALFERRRGVTVFLHFGGSGTMLSQLELSGRGDVYFPGSSDYMEIAKRRGAVDPATERRVVYLLPAINVPAGNPKGVATLEDLARPGMRVGIARADAVCVGLYGIEVLHAAGLYEKVRPNIVTEAESCAKVAQICGLGSVDAVLGWRVFHWWNPEKIATVMLPPERIPRIGYIPVAIGTKAVNRLLAQQFIDFLTGPESQAIFRRWGYLTTEAEARALARPDTPVGGEWALPAAAGGTAAP